jgi:hypothetical protein
MGARRPLFAKEFKGNMPQFVVSGNDLDLEAGPHVAVVADTGYADSQCNRPRPMGGGLGNATGETNGAVLDGFAGLGSVTITPQAGGRVTDICPGRF